MTAKREDDVAIEATAVRVFADQYRPTHSHVKLWLQQAKYLLGNADPDFGWFSTGRP